MTSEKLVDQVSGYRWSGGEKLSISPDEVYLAGTIAQQEILSELRLLEDSVQLALVSSQEQYHFPPTAITGIAVGAPVTVTSVAHGLTTGDEVLVYGVLGMTAANGRWKITKVTADTFTLDGSNIVVAYSSGGYVMHMLSAASMIRETGILKKTDASGVAMTGHVTKKLRSWIELHRSKFGESSVDGQVLYFYEEYTDPITIGFMGVPSTAFKVSVPIYRGHTPADDLSATVNPIVPDRYQKLLMLGTLFHALDMKDGRFAEQKAMEFRKKFEIEKERVLSVHGLGHLVQGNDLSGEVI